MAKPKWERLDFFFLYICKNKSFFVKNLWHLCLIACRCCWSYPGVNLSDEHLAEQKASVSCRLSCWALNQWITQSTSQKEQRSPSSGLNRRLIFHSHHLFNRTQIHTFVMNSITRLFSHCVQNSQYERAQPLYLHLTWELATDVLTWMSNWIQTEQLRDGFFFSPPPFLL